MARSSFPIGPILLLGVAAALLFFAFWRMPPLTHGAARGRAAASTAPPGATGAVSAVAAASAAGAAPVPDLPHEDPEELVRAAIGRWKTADGRLEVDIDPPRPRLGRQTPYHLMVVKDGAHAYGCDFSEAVSGAELDGYEETYRAWCGGEARSKKGRTNVLGLSVDRGVLRMRLVVGERALLEATFELVQKR